MTRPQWTLFVRDPVRGLVAPAPIKSLSGVERWLGVGTGAGETEWSPRLAEHLVEGCEIEVRRGRKYFTSGKVTRIGDVWPGGLSFQFVTDQQILARRPVVPDPTRSAIDQTTVPRYERTGPASTLVHGLIREQMGPTAHPDWQVPGLTLAADPVVGPSASLLLRYEDLAEAMRPQAEAADLGVLVSRVDGDYRVSVQAPTDRPTAVFSVGLGNLTSYEFVREAPDATRVLIVGAGEDPPESAEGEPELTPQEREDYKLTHASQVLLDNTDPLTLAWRFPGTAVVTESSLFEVDKLATAGLPRLTEDGAQFSLRCTLRDTDRMAFQQGYDLGDRVRILVGRPGQPRQEINDVVREVLYEVSRDSERFTPSVGSAGSSVLPGSPSRSTLAKLRNRLNTQERRG